MYVGGRTFCVVVAVAVLAPACGGSESSEPQATTLRLKTQSASKLAYDQAELRAPAGRVTLVMENTTFTPHNISLEGNGVDLQGEIVSNGQTSRVTLALEPGVYTFYCAVPEHREGGMVGKLTIG